AVAVLVGLLAAAGAAVPSAVALVAELPAGGAGGCPIRRATACRRRSTAVGSVVSRAATCSNGSGAGAAGAAGGGGTGGSGAGAGAPGGQLLAPGAGAAAGGAGVAPGGDASGDAGPSALRPGGH